MNNPHLYCIMLVFCTVASLAPDADDAQNSCFQMVRLALPCRYMRLFLGWSWQNPCIHVCIYIYIHIYIYIETGAVAPAATRGRRIKPGSFITCFLEHSISHTLINLWHSPQLGACMLSPLHNLFLRTYRIIWRDLFFLEPRGHSSGPWPLSYQTRQSVCVRCSCTFSDRWYMIWERLFQHVFDHDGNLAVVFDQQPQADSIASKSFMRSSSRTNKLVEL